jgi:ubiquinone/menaquinone biosynthesis C-methylase UbiE
MKQPTWKKWLSYLFEIHLESAPSEVNPHLYVSLKNGRYQLCTAKAIYSFADLYGNFRQAFQHLNWNIVPGKSTLMLGFGLGSIPYMLEHIFQKEFDYTIVEIDENVIQLAQKYVMSEIHSPSVFHLADAFQFVITSEAKFDLICMDVFVEDVIPLQMETIEYCAALRDLLSPGGVLLFNRLSRTKSDMKATKAFFESIFLKVFEDGVYLDVNGNWILSNQKMAFISTNR